MEIYPRKYDTFISDFTVPCGPDFAKDFMTVAINF